jgi:hypothetical protein
MEDDEILQKKKEWDRNDVLIGAGNGRVRSRDGPKEREVGSSKHKDKGRERQGTGSSSGTNGIHGKLK